jgi:hypothetical protein
VFRVVLVYYLSDGVKIHNLLFLLIFI